MKKKVLLSIMLTGIIGTNLLSAPLSGNALSKVKSEIKGDINSDGKFSISDILSLQKWLLNLNYDIKIDNLKTADINNDNTVNIFDLSIMKEGLINGFKETNRNINVSNIEELCYAVKNAMPGDTILVAAGTYDYSTYQEIEASADGTKDTPITIKAADEKNPPVIKGANYESGYVLHITGDYWIIENLNITSSQKGIVIDNSNYTVIRNCDIGNTGSEAVAIRDGSSHCLVQNCNIHDSGIVTPGYGEGVYIGSSYTVSGFDYKCDYNTVDKCTFKNVAAEHIDVKEYTTGTEISNCTFYGDGISGANYAGSFIDIAGNECYVHDNIGYRNNNANVVAAFEIHKQVEGWGNNNKFENNTLYMDREYGEIDTNRPIYVVDGWDSDFTVKNNYVDYGDGLFKAVQKHYNSENVTFLD